MASLAEALTYAVPGLMEARKSQADYAAKQEERHLKRRKLELEERQQNLQEAILRQGLEEKQRQQALRSKIEELIPLETSPTQIAPMDVGDLATGGVPMRPGTTGGMEIPGQEIPGARLQRAFAAAFPEKAAESFFPKSQGLMNIPPGGTVFDPRTSQPRFTAPQAPERPVPVAPGGTLVRPGTGEPIFTAPERTERPRSISEAELLLLADMPESQRLPGFPNISPTQARQALKGKAEQRGEEAGARTRESLEQQGRLIKIIEDISRTKAGGASRGRFEESLEQPITPAEATLYRVPAGTTRGQLLQMNPKPVTEADIDAGTQFNAAKAMLQEYKDVAGRLLTAKDAVGSLGQRVRLTFGAFVRTDEDAIRLRALQATVPLLVRALGEKGTLATQDVQRALNAVPDFADTQQTAQAKIAQLEKFIATVESRIKALRPGLERPGASPPSKAGFRYDPSTNRLIPIGP